MKNFLTTLAASSVTPVNPNGNDDLVGSITGILNAIIGILGLVCVVVIIIGGVNYMTSAGDAGKVKKGKDTILYGCIGLVVCALAFAVVNFVISGILGQ
ncbi:MAG: pilin [Candidatus Saccharibacteria bacterium]|nr:pilin [Candidatus Saccharibacteria bacterium]